MSDSKDNRTVSIAFWVRPDERDRIDQAAEADDRPRSSFLRLAALDRVQQVEAQQPKEAA